MPANGSVTVAGGALDLLASIVSSNVDQLASVTDSLITYEQRQKRYYAQALIDLVEGIAAIPPMMRTAYLDDLLEDALVATNAAWRDLQGDPP